jgi:hypothetical protein
MRRQLLPPLTWAQQRIDSRNDRRAVRYRANHPGVKWTNPNCGTMPTWDMPHVTNGNDGRN